MIKLKDLLFEQYEYSCALVDIPKSDESAFVNLAKTIPSKDLYINKSENINGIEDEPHITVLYGLTDETPENVIKKLSKVKGTAKATLGKVSVFKDNPKFDVIKVDVNSPSLKKLNDLLRQLDNECKFKTYKPHLTLAYVKKGKGDKYIGDTRFEGKSYQFSEIVFSSHGAGHKKYKIKLNG
jgi:2'-5' RNA ligase